MLDLSIRKIDYAVVLLKELDVLDKTHKNDKNSFFV